MEKPYLYSPAETSRLLSTSRSRLYELMGAGEIRWVRKGRRRYILREEIERYVAGLTAE